MMVIKIAVTFAAMTNHYPTPRHLHATLACIDLPPDPRPHGGCMAFGLLHFPAPAPPGACRHHFIAAQSPNRSSKISSSFFWSAEWLLANTQPKMTAPPTPRRPQAGASSPPSIRPLRHLRGSLYLSPMPSRLVLHIRPPSHRTLQY